MGLTKSGKALSIGRGEMERVGTCDRVHALGCQRQGRLAWCLRKLDFQLCHDSEGNVDGFVQVGISQRHRTSIKVGITGYLEYAILQRRLRVKRGLPTAETVNQHVAKVAYELEPLPVHQRAQID